MSEWAGRPRQTPFTGRRVKHHGDGTEWYCPDCACWHRGDSHPLGYEACPKAPPRPEPGTTPIPSSIRRSGTPQHVRVNLGGVG